MNKYHTISMLGFAFDLAAEGGIDLARTTAQSTGDPDFHKAVEKAITSGKRFLLVAGCFDGEKMIVAAYCQDTQSLPGAFYRVKDYLEENVKAEITAWVIPPEQSMASLLREVM